MFNMYGLSPSDAELFRLFADEFRRRFLQRVPPAPPTPVTDGPWGSLVLTPVGGIPAMWEENGLYTGTGTRLNDVAGTGTGTAVGDEGDRPGFADCDEYALEHGTPGNPGRYLARPRLRKTGRVLTVYNPTFTEVAGNQFVTAVRDPYGDWWVPSLGLLFTGCT